MDNYEIFDSLVKSLEAGGYDAAPSTLVQGSALQVENLAAMMETISYEDKHIKFQKNLASEPVKATLVQFDRNLGYGIFGGSAQLEGDVGQEENSDYVRIAVPMAYYSATRRVTLASTLVDTVDGKKSDERYEEENARKLAGDIEFDLWGGLEKFSNGGVFDGHPAAVPALPNIHGLGLQVRQSDFQSNAQDLMFNEFGSAESVVLNVGGPLTQTVVEDASLRSALNHGSADELNVDPVVLHTYNKISFGKERVNLAGSPQTATGSDLRTQWVSGGSVKVEATNWLRGKYQPSRVRPQSSGAPAGVSAAQGAGATPFALNDAFVYYATAVNVKGESRPSGTDSITIATAGNFVTLTITHPASGTFTYFNVYRSEAGGSAASAKFIGSVVAVPGAATTDFIDLGNRQPAAVTGHLVQKDTMKIAELAPYSKVELARTDLSSPWANFRFLTLKVTQPRKNVLVDNLTGTF